MSTPPLIDSHAHLDFKQFDGQLQALLDRAAAAGVYHTLTVGTDLASSRRALALAERHGCLSAAAGVHPHEAAGHDPADWPELQRLWAEEQVVAVGETGLDYHYNFSPPEVQRALFRKHLEAYWQACEQWADARLDAPETASPEAAKKGASKKPLTRKSRPRSKRS